MIDFDYLWNLWNCEKSTFPNNYQGVMLAASGHTDSTALFHLFCQFSKGEKNFLKGLIHVNYKLRGHDSEHDQKLICDLAKTHHLPFHCLEVDSAKEFPASGQSFQDWARTKRYDFFSEFTKKGYVIALAHHADDLAENIVFRICRGAEPENIAGMKRINGFYWRPILHLEHNQLVGYLKDRGLEFNEDASNQENEYTRNFIRNEILPRLERVHPGATKKLLRLQKDVAELSTYTQNQLHREFGDLNAFNRADLSRLPFAAFKQLLSLAFNERYGQQPKFASNHLEAYFSELVSDRPLRKSFNLAPGFYLRNNRERIEIVQEAEATATKAFRAFYYAGRLAPADQCTIQVNDGSVWLISNHESQDIEFQITMARNNAIFKALTSPKRWRIKDLKHRNRALLSKAAILYIVRTGKSEYLYDGSDFVCPDDKGFLENINVSEISIDQLSVAELV